MDGKERRHTVAHSHRDRHMCLWLLLPIATLIALKYRSKWCAHKTVLIICLDLNVPMCMRSTVFIWTCLLLLSLSLFFEFFDSECRSDYFVMCQTISLPLSLSHSLSLVNNFCFSFFFSKCWLDAITCTQVFNALSAITMCLWSFWIACRISITIVSQSFQFDSLSFPLLLLLTTFLSSFFSLLLTLILIMGEFSFGFWRQSSHFFLLFASSIILMCFIVVVLGLILESWTQLIDICLFALVDE